jgi:hypothetical protein
MRPTPTSLSLVLDLDWPQRFSTFKLDYLPRYKKKREKKREKKRVYKLERSFAWLR